MRNCHVCEMRMLRALLLYSLVSRVGAAKKSSGCGKSSLVPAGSKGTLHGSFAGLDRSYILFVPSSYNKSSPMPLVVSTHGWGGSASQDLSSSGLSVVAEKYGFVVAFAQGFADNTNFGSWASWNVVGSTDSPGTSGPICAPWANSPSYCYDSCAPCSDSPQCDWTTCADDVTPSGVGKSNVSGFLPELYEHLCNTMCIDEERQYHTGFSNGGMATYQVGVSLSDRVAAIVPVAGSFEVGFQQYPSLALPVMDVHGFFDHQVPANSSLSQDGWYYVVNSAIFRGWRGSNRCSGTGAVHWPTALDGVQDLYCVSEGEHCEAPVVRCGWSGSHSYFSDPSSNGELVWGFLSQFSRGSSGHVKRVSQMQRRLQAATSMRAGAIPNLRRLRPLGVHYGDPHVGCLTDEDKLILGKDGAVCSPRRVSLVTDSSDDRSACVVGGVAASVNGCPQDSPKRLGSKAWPICLKTDILGNASAGPFGCFLVCGPCRDASNPSGCSESAHKDCPSGSLCQPGWLRSVTQGICVYPGASSSSEGSLPSSISSVV